MDKTSANTTNILRAIEDLGCRATFFPAGNLPYIHRDILELSSKRLVNSDYFDDEIATRFDFSFTQKNNGFNSILVIASPRYITDVCFDSGISYFKTSIPATYTNGMIERKIKDVLSKFFDKGSLCPVPNSLPLKAIAARSGLAKYGRNNLCYVDGMGSYIMLSAFYTEICMEDTVFYDYGTLTKCLDCRLCVDNCPTGCIKEDKLLIEAQRCFTYLNERTSTLDDLLSRYGTGTLLGCNECQNICPQNKDFINMREGPIYFKSEETVGLLNDSSIDDIPAYTATKIVCLGLEEYYDQIKKNLRLLLKNQDGRLISRLSR